MPARPRDTESIRQQLAARLPELRERYGVQRLTIFGSYARNEQDQTSDLDLLVEFDPAPGMLDYVRLGRELEEMLQLQVDLVTPEGLRPHWRRHIMRSVVPV